MISSIRSGILHGLRASYVTVCTSFILLKMIRLDYFRRAKALRRKQWRQERRERKNKLSENMGDGFGNTSLSILEKLRKKLSKKQGRKSGEFLRSTGNASWGGWSDGSNDNAVNSSGEINIGYDSTEDMNLFAEHEMSDSSKYK
jgi:hypothetical protein